MRRAGDGTSRPGWRATVGSSGPSTPLVEHVRAAALPEGAEQEVAHGGIRPRRRSFVTVAGPRSGELSGCRPNLGGDLPSTTTSPEGTTERTTERVPAREDVPTGRARGWMRRLASDCWRRPSLTVAALTASVLGVSLEAVGPLLIATAVDRAVAGSTAGLVPLVIAMAAIAVVRFGAAFLRRYLGGRLSLGVQHDLRRRVFGSVSRLDGPEAGRAAHRAGRLARQLRPAAGPGPAGHGPAGRGHARAAGGLDRRSCCGSRRCSRSRR